MTYEELRDIIETKIVALGGLYYSGTLQTFNHDSQNVPDDEVVFLNEISDQNNDITVLLAGGIQNTFYFRFYVFEKHAQDLNEYQLDTYYSVQTVNANKLLLSLNDKQGNNYQILNGNARRVKMITPNNFAGVLLTFSIRIRGDCT